MYESARPKQPSWFSRLLGKKPLEAVEPEKVAGFIAETDLDKAWHGIHYLLTKSAWEGEPPLNFIVLGGEPIGDVDVGYGPARAFRPDQVREINSALQEIDASTLRARFDPQEMMSLDIYPTFWDRDLEDDDVLGYCIDNFEGLKSFVSEASSKNLGMLIHLC